MSIQEIIKRHENGIDVTKKEARAVMAYYSRAGQWTKYKYWMGVYEDLK